MPTTSLTIGHLPTELLLTIFEHLTLSDRKAASLVNQRWSSVIDQLNYMRDDTRIVIRGNGQHHKTGRDPIHTLLQSTRKVRSVSLLDDVTFDSNITQLWKRFSDTITEVKLVRCTNLDNTALCDMLTHCRKLKSLKLYAPCFSQWGIFLKDNYLVTKANHKSMRPALESITHLTVCDAVINDLHFRNLLYHLPNLSSLNTTICYFQKTNADESRHLSRRCLLQWLETGGGEKLRELQIKHVDDDLLLDLATVKGLSLRLCRLQLEQVEVHSVEKFLKRHRQLRDLRVGFEDRRTAQRVLPLLEGLQCLKEVKIDVGLDVGGFALVKDIKSLEKLTLNLSTKDSDLTLSRNVSRPRMKEMHLLASHSSCFLPNHFYEALTRTYSRLTSFCTSGIILEAVNFKTLCQGLKNLRELSVDRSEYIDATALLSVRQVKGLRRLVLLSCSQITEEVLGSLSLLELSYLRMERMESISSEAVHQLCKNCPSLEELFLTTNDEHMDPIDVASLTQRFPRLKSVSITQSKTNRKKFKMDDFRAMIFDR